MYWKKSRWVFRPSTRTNARRRAPRLRKAFCGETMPQSPRVRRHQLFPLQKTGREAASQGSSLTKSLLRRNDAAKPPCVAAPAFPLTENRAGGSVAGLLAHKKPFAAERCRKAAVCGGTGFSAYRKQGGRLRRRTPRSRKAFCGETMPQSRRERRPGGFACARLLRYRKIK